MDRSIEEGYGRNEKKVKAAAQAYGCDRYYTDWRELIKDAQVLPILIYDEAVITYDWGSATTLSNIALVISLLLLFFYLQIFGRMG